MDEAATASVTDVMKWFQIPVQLFKIEWLKLSVTDKVQLRKGIGDGTLTY
jgi:hypothetical protein